MFLKTMEVLNICIETLCFLRYILGYCAFIYRTAEGLDKKWMMDDVQQRATSNPGPLQRGRSLRTWGIHSIN